MGVAELKKTELYYHKSVQDDVAKALQYSGACQIIESAADEPGERPAGAADRLAACEEQETRIRYLFRALGGYYKDPVSSIDRLLGERPALSLTELAKTAQETDLQELVSSVKERETRLNELRVEAAQLTTTAGILAKISDFPYSLSVFGEGTRVLKGLLGTLPVKGAEILKNDLAAYAGETELFAADQGPRAKEAWVAILYARTHEQPILEVCARGGMTFVELPAHLSGTVAEESEKTAARLDACAREEAGILESLAQTAEEWMPAVQRVSDYWKIMHDRYRALCASDSTDSTVRTCFWVPAEVLPHLQKRIESIASATAFVASTPVREDNPPTLLKNRALIRPAEVLTNLYSPPPYGELEPTPFLAPFFFIFFGMCLGDAGYALVMGGVIAMLFKKYRKIPFSVKNFVNIFSIGAVTTFIYGAITGSFFGDFIDVFFFMAPLRPLKNALFVIDPMANPMAVLGLSLLLGVTHLMFGLAIAAYDAFRKGNYVDAVGDKACWILFIVGLILVGAGSSGSLPSALYTAGLGMTAVGGCIIFWYAGRGTKNIFLKVGSGLYALYGSTSYLGDILSYSRLLALGLGSAVVGSIINLLSIMAAGIPCVGWVLAIVIVIGGHLFGIAVNLLGAFVHSMRLQYVEFFSKFYSGGGSIFRPLAFATQYIDVIDTALDPESGLSS
jgi:V/A-type H+-transporting ATPase subunit I